MKRKLLTKLNKENKYPFLFLLPSLIGVAVFFLIPFIMTFYYAFTQGIRELKFVGFDNFIELLKNPVFILATKNTFSFLIISVPILVVVALFISIILDKIPNLSYRLGILSPLIIPSTTLILGVDILISDYLGAFFSIDINKSENAFPFVVFLYIIKNLGYMVILITSAIGSVSRDYKEAFFLDSKSEIKFTRYILIPSIEPMVFFVIILSLMNGLKISKEVILLYGNYPPESVYMLQTFMNNNFFKLSYQSLSTSSILLILVISIFIVFYLKIAEKKYSQLT